jgi:BASS family bile acid:Na+ symporter
MVSVGFGHTLQSILGPLRNVRNVVRAIVANFVLVPLLAYIVVQLIPLELPRAIGLFLIATAAGAPFVVKLVEAAGSDVSLSASLLVLLLPITIVYMPIIVPLALPRAEVSARAIASPLVITMLLPLAIGLFVRAKAERWALRLQPWMQRLSTFALVLLVVATVLSNFQAILDLFELDTILAAAIIIVGAFGIGFLLGGPDRESREVLGLGTGQRNVAAATVVAAEVVRLPETTATVVLASLVALIILFTLATLLRDRGE